MSRKIIVLGGSLSGPTAASRAREVDANAEIILIERSQDISYAVGGLPYHLSGEVEVANDLAPYRKEFFKKYYNVDVRTGVSVNSFDPNARTVQTSEGELSYDSLIYALGAGSIIPSIFSEESSNMSLLRNMSHLRNIASLLKSGAQKIIVVGGGFYGIEAAECLAKRGCNVTLIEKGSQILPSFSLEIAKEAQKALEETGATVVLNANVSAVNRQENRITSIEMGDQKLATDLVLICAGVTPRTEIFTAAGGEVKENGAIKVNSNCQTNLPNVYATSICVAHKHAVSGKTVWTAQAADADKTAQVAGANAAGAISKVRPTLDTAIIRVGKLCIARTGLIKDKRSKSVRLYSYSGDPFFKGNAPLEIVLYFHPKNNQVQGAEVIGKVGVDKRIDILATAIYGKLKVKDLSQIDLAYSPPFGLARDPINAIGNIATQSDDVPSFMASQLEEMNDVLYLDVRSKAGQSEAPFNAKKVDLSQLEGLKKEMLAANQVIFISEYGRESYLAANTARQMGVKAGYLAGGIKAWKRWSTN